MINHRHILAFEDASDPDLEFIPMFVRMKLDLAGCKIGLTQWQQLRPAYRVRLINTQLEGPEHYCRFRRSLDDALRRAGSWPSEDLPVSKRDALITWWDPDRLPHDLRARWDTLGLDIDWRSLSTFGRYVAWFLLRKGREEKLLAALTESIMYDRCRTPLSQGHGLRPRRSPAPISKASVRE